MHHILQTDMHFISKSVYIIYTNCCTWLHVLYKFLYTFTSFLQSFDRNVSETTVAVVSARALQSAKGYAFSLFTTIAFPLFLWRRDDQLLYSSHNISRTTHHLYPESIAVTSVGSNSDSLEAICKNSSKFCILFLASIICGPYWKKFCVHIKIIIHC